VSGVDLDRAAPPPRTVRTAFQGPTLRYLNNVTPMELGCTVYEWIDVAGLLINRLPLRMNGFIDEEGLGVKVTAFCYRSRHPIGLKRYSNGA
jgi:hypothetical protein